MPGEGTRSPEQAASWIDRVLSGVSAGERSGCSIGDSRLRPLNRKAAQIRSELGQMLSQVRGY